MFAILLGMAAIIVAGLLWRIYLGAEKAELIRGHLVRTVYDIFLPALVLHVMWQAEVSLNSIRLPLVSALAILLSLLAASLIYAGGKWLPGSSTRKRKAAGALLLASSFGNFTYLGLPVLTQTFGPWAQSVAIYFDLFASTPLLFTVGILVASHFSHTTKAAHVGIELIRVPALWAAVAGVLASAFHIPMPVWLDETLGVLGAAVVPLMLLSIGMALRWQSGWAERIPMLLPMVVIQLVFMPLVVWAACIGVGMPGNLLAPAIIEGAMPTMVLGLVICDRFKLDTSLYAEAVTVTTALSLLTLPLWLAVVS
ncbi:MAG: AEC family transporter [Mariprofundaceae bacterium]|nr:AEC family transporter [Mariprofundaceae bacterium]